MMRRIMCAHYSRCLMEAATKNRKEFDCSGCEKYKTSVDVEEAEAVAAKVAACVTLLSQSKETKKPEESVMEEQKKVCVKCGKEKSLSDYHKSKAGKSGVKNICKDCCAEYAEEYNKKKKGLGSNPPKGTRPDKPIIPTPPPGPGSKKAGDAVLEKAVEVLIAAGHLSREKLDMAIEFCRIER